MPRTRRRGRRRFRLWRRGGSRRGGRFLWRGSGRWRRSGCDVPALGSLQRFIFTPRLFCCSFPIGHVAEHLQASRELLGGKHPVLLIDGSSYQRFELAAILSVRPCTSAIALLIECLEPVFHLISHPDVAIPVDRDPFGPGKVSRPAVAPIMLHPSGRG